MRKVFILILIALLAVGCRTKRDVFEGVEMTPQTVRIVRFDSAFVQVDTTRLNESVAQLYKAYPDFTPYFVNELLGLENADSLVGVLPAFLNDTTLKIRQMIRDEQAAFADITDIQREMNQAFTRIGWLFPDMTIPDVYLYVSGFVSPVYFPNDAIIGIGADMYLGSDYPIYSQLVYEYQKQTMRKECVVGDAVSAYLFRNLPFNGRQNRLLDQMIYHGKIMYLLDQILPEEEEEQIIGYSKEQWEWCEDHERAIWQRIMDKRDLFQTDGMILTSYMNDGPFTSEVSQDSPGRLGAWVGWRIVESYMNSNETVGMRELLDEEDAQVILENSHYRP
ncbi:MAG: hypothetical protein II551_03205 [Paludibacteraceae bacterium]|nr:hypothetical protein [Paludibacteraceae bacterium]